MEKNNQKNHEPPRWMDFILGLLIKTKYLEYLRGDLTELFYRNIKKKGLFPAQYLFCLDAFSAIRINHLKGPNINIFTSILPDMFSNYLKIAFRNLSKRKTISLINVLGLAIGIAGGLLSYLHIQYELSYDKYHSNSDRIYRIITGNILQTSNP